MEMATPETHTSSSPLLYFYFLLFLIFFPHWPPFLYPFQIPMAKGLRTHEQSFIFIFILFLCSIL
jgi:4-amino-4-deoxy-L-arabinose transferase-like glycosyltransferase